MVATPQVPVVVPLVLAAVALVALGTILLGHHLTQLTGGPEFRLLLLVLPLAGLVVALTLLVPRQAVEVLGTKIMEMLILGAAVLQAQATVLAAMAVPVL
jgi:hypothetical protein